MWLRSLDSVYAAGVAGVADVDIAGVGMGEKVPDDDEDSAADRDAGLVGHLCEHGRGAFTRDQRGHHLSSRDPEDAVATTESLIQASSRRFPR